MTVDEVIQVVEYAEGCIGDLSPEQLSLLVAYLQQLAISKMS